MGNNYEKSKGRELRIQTISSLVTISSIIVMCIFKVPDDETN